MKKRYKFIVAVHLFLLNEGSILLMLRQNTGWGDGLFSVPAGHVDGGEKIKEAMIREAREEIGLNLSSSELQLIHIMHRQPIGESERIDFFYWCNGQKINPENCEPFKCKELRWTNLDSLPGNMVPYIRRAIDEWQSNQLMSEFEQN